ncbi:hypothetical protein RB195_003298 [Necator americanus]|uniref:Uncharacterized protein n=1 Tax=Necator americanus TaxID=51031 RepID=A0ABR1DNI7_NECAM
MAGQLGVATRIIELHPYAPGYRKALLRYESWPGLAAKRSGGEDPKPAAMSAEGLALGLAPLNLAGSRPGSHTPVPIHPSMVSRMPSYSRFLNSCG